MKRSLKLLCMLGLLMWPFKMPAHAQDAYYRITRSISDALVTRDSILGAVFKVNFSDTGNIEIFLIGNTSDKSQYLGYKFNLRDIDISKPSMFSENVSKDFGFMYLVCNGGAECVDQFSTLLPASKRENVEIGVKNQIIADQVVRLLRELRMNIK